MPQLSTHSQCECWKPVEGYKGLYEVSCTGKVKSLARTTSRTEGTKVIIQPIAEKILSAGGKLYPTVNLCKDGKAKSVNLHDLVSHHFIGKRPKGFHCCHNDGNPFNPHVSNLRYDSVKGNASDRHLHGTDAKGENNPRAKLTETIVREIKIDLKTMRQCNVARKYNLPSSTIGTIKQGKTWGYIKA